MPLASESDAAGDQADKAKTYDNCCSSPGLVFSSSSCFFVRCFLSTLAVRCCPAVVPTALVGSHGFPRPHPVHSSCVGFLTFRLSAHFPNVLYMFTFRDVPASERFPMTPARCRAYVFNIDIYVLRNRAQGLELTT